MYCLVVLRVLNCFLQKPIVSSTNIISGVLREIEDRKEFVNILCLQCPKAWWLQHAPYTLIQLVSIIIGHCWSPQGRRMSKRWFFHQMYIYDSKADGFATLSEVLLHIAENPRHCGRQKGTSRAQVSNAASFYSNVRHGRLLKTFPRHIF